MNWLRSEVERIAMHACIQCANNVPTKSHPKTSRKYVPIRNGYNAINMGISMPSRYCENDYHVGNGDQYKNGKPNQ